MKRPTLGHIYDFLLSQQACHPIRIPESSMKVEITRLASDQKAKHGELSWLNAKALEKNPSRRGEFQGSALILPKEAQQSSRDPGHLVEFFCENPKLAFILILKEFFSDLARSTLPLQGEPSISRSAKIGKNVVIQQGVVIGDHVEIGDHVTIGANSVLDHCLIQDHVTIGCNCTIGQPGFGYEKDSQGLLYAFPHVGKVVIGSQVEIGNNTCIDRGSLEATVISEGCKVDNLVHIAHNVFLGKNSVVIANSMIAGSCEIEEGAWIAPSASILNQLKVGAHSLVGLGAVVTKSVPSHAVVVGNPARALVKNG